MQVIPVVDLMQGVVVRGVAGDRARYRPIESRLTASTNVLDVAGAFREQFGFRQLYLADLDAIAGKPRHLGVYRQLADSGMQVLLDAGLRHADEALELMQAGASAVVAGLETIAGPDELAALCRELGPERVIFSLDLRGGAPLLAGTQWPAHDALAIVDRAVHAGIRTLIVLELSRVGTGAGIGSFELCRQIRASHPELQLITGGGVRGMEELRTLAGAGIDGVLVASALHDGRLTREMVGGEG